MAFSLRSRPGWNRLWIVVAVLWWGFIALIGAGNYPRAEAIDADYEHALSRLHEPEPLDLNVALGLIGAEKHPEPPASAVVEKRRVDAVSLRDQALEELPNKQREHLLEGGLLALVPFGVYLFACLFMAVVRWVYRGFSKV